MTPYYDAMYYDKWELINNNSVWGGTGTTTDAVDAMSTWMSSNNAPMTIKVTAAAQTQSVTYDVQSVTIDVNQITHAMDKAQKEFEFLRRAMKPTNYRRKVVPKSAFGPIRRDPPPRTFNKYINASDLLEEFIRYVGAEGVRQGEVLDLPIELFVKWLVIRACEEDAEEPNVTLELPTRKTQPRCLGCQRFMRRDVPVPIHDSDCATRYFDRVA